MVSTAPRLLLTAFTIKAKISKLGVRNLGIRHQKTADGGFLVYLNHGCFVYIFNRFKRWQLFKCGHFSPKHKRRYSNGPVRMP